MMIKRVAAVVITSLIILTVSYGLLNFENERAHAYTPHAPISINGNTDFATKAASESWPGDGSPGNPYIIEGYDIAASVPHGIYIQNTDVHFVIRDCYIHDGGMSNKAIFLSNLVNGTIEHCNLTSSANGIHFDGVSDSVIFNNTLYSNNHNGIYFESSSDNTISNNSIHSNAEQSIYFLSNSNLNTISNNTIYWNGRNGLYINTCSGNKAFNNTFMNNSGGIHLQYTTTHEVNDNTFVNDGIYLAGNDLPAWNTHTITNNIANGRPIFYYKNVGGITVPGDAITVILANCNQFTIDGINASDVSVGVEMGYSWGISISNSTISSNHRDGIYGYLSWDNTIVNNSIHNNGQRGMYLGGDSNGNNISDNRIYRNDMEGVIIDRCDDNDIINNMIHNNSQGINFPSRSEFNNIHNNSVRDNLNWGIVLRLYSHNNIINDNRIINNGNEAIHFYRSSSNDITNNILSIFTLYGIELQESSGNNVINNTICNSKNWHGIFIKSGSNSNTIKNNTVYGNAQNGIHITGSGSNSVTENTVYNNSNYGIYVYGSSGTAVHNNTVYANNHTGINISQSTGNTIYHNNIINNRLQGYDDSNNGNQWDNGYPSGGNYWDDFDEPSEGAYDDYQGIDQNVSGSDGKVDNGTIGGGGMNPYIIDGDSQDNYPLIYPLGNYTILYEGWNLISIPFIQQDTDLGMVLKSIKGSFDTVEWYNTSDDPDYWKINNTNKLDTQNDLDNIDHKMGFWIHIIEPHGALFQYLGTQPTSNQTINLYPGWNLVGYPSQTIYNRTAALNNLTFGTHVDSIWTFDAANQKWESLGESDYFIPGRGYWINAKVECEWEVPL